MFFKFFRFIRIQPLPLDWPSIYHNKCSKSRCKYPNLPQAAEGTYNCLGASPSGLPCKGTYYVTASAAELVTEFPLLRTQPYKNCLKQQLDPNMLRPKKLRGLDKEHRNFASTNLAHGYRDKSGLQRCPHTNAANGSLYNRYQMSRESAARKPPPVPNHLLEKHNIVHPLEKRHAVGYFTYYYPRSSEPLTKFGSGKFVGNRF